MTLISAIVSLVWMALCSVFSGRRFGFYGIQLCIFSVAFVLSILLFSAGLMLILGGWIRLDVLLWAISLCVGIPISLHFLKECCYRTFATALYRLLPAYCTYASFSWRDKRLYLREQTEPSLLTAHAFLQYQERLEAFSRECAMPKQEWFDLLRYLPKRIRDCVEEVNVHLFYREQELVLSFHLYFDRSSSIFPMHVSIPVSALRLT